MKFTKYGKLVDFKQHGHVKKKFINNQKTWHLKKNTNIFQKQGNLVKTCFKKDAIVLMIKKRFTIYVRNGTSHNPKNACVLLKHINTFMKANLHFLQPCYTFSFSFNFMMTNCQARERS